MRRFCRFDGIRHDLSIHQQGGMFRDPICLNGRVTSKCRESFRIPKSAICQEEIDGTSHVFEKRSVAVEQLRLDGLFDADVNDATIKLEKVSEIVNEMDEVKGRGQQVRQADLAIIAERW